MVSYMLAFMVSAEIDSLQAFFGCIFSAWSADKYGRKRTIQIGCVLIIIGGALNAGSVALSMFGVGRAVAGIGSGILAVVVPMYQGEVATAETRGAMMCVVSMIHTAGRRGVIRAPRACPLFLHGEVR